MSYPDQLLQFRRWHRFYWGIALGALALLAGLEWQFAVVERSLGSYLVWQNQEREKTGRRWQIEQKQVLAGTRLEKISRDLRQRENQIRQFVTFAQFIEWMQSNDRQRVDPAAFIRLYGTLVTYFQPLIIEPDSMITWRLRGQIDNVLCHWSGESLEFLFLDRSNNVFFRSALSPAQTQMVLQNGKEVVIDVNRDPRFADRTYSMSNFHRKLLALPAPLRRQFLQAMAAFAGDAGPSARVAISNKIVDEFVEVAVAPDNSRAHLYFIPEDWIIDLISLPGSDDF